MMGIMALQINIDAVGADMSEWLTVRETYFERTVKWMRVIDADVLFERACNLEAQALAYVGKIVNDESKIEEWRIWSAILAERTAFKHDIFDAPDVKPERKKGKWINIRHDNIAECDQCGITGRAWMNICFDCGADMREPEDIPMEYFESGGR